MLTAALLIVAKTRRQPRRPQQANVMKMGCTRALEYHSAIKKNETLASAATDGT